MSGDLKGKRVLLLQGPNGPFFKRLSVELAERGAEVLKVNFNGGDQLYFDGALARSFRGELKQWPEYLASLLEEYRPSHCFLFGDYRPIHRAATPLLREHGVEVFVFEDGYLRPDFVTIERGGVNGRSTLRDLGRNWSLPEGAEAPEPYKVRRAFAWCIAHTVVYAVAVAMGCFSYPKYRHHRDLNPLRQAFFWARSWWRRRRFAKAEAPLLERAQGDMSGRFFLAALQVFNDSQIETSRFDDVRDFIREVIASFAKQASVDDSLVLKHHPGDRAYREYGGFIQRLAEQHGVAERVWYVHDLHLPTLLTHAKGTVVINSTVGWSSLHHGTPVLALDDTIYGYLGFNSSGTLDEFWGSQAPVDLERVADAESWLRLHNQANGSCWVPLEQAGPSGLIWPRLLKIADGPV